MTVTTRYEVAIDTRGRTATAVAHCPVCGGRVLYEYSIVRGICRELYVDCIHYKGRKDGDLAIFEGVKQ